MYQELCKQVDKLRKSENANANEDFSEFGELLFRILGMHPYGTYGWQGQERATHKQLQGKGERIIQQTLQAVFDLVGGAFTFSPPFLFPYLADRNAQFVNNEEYKKFVEKRVQDIVPIQEWQDYIDGKLKLDDPQIQLYETLKYMVYMFYEKCLYSYEKLRKEIKVRYAESPLCAAEMEAGYLPALRENLINFKTDSINWKKPQSYNLEEMKKRLKGIKQLKRNDLFIFRINLSLGASETEADRNTYVEAIQTMISDSDKWFESSQIKPDIINGLHAALPLPLEDGLWDSADNQIFYVCKEKIRCILNEIGKVESPDILVYIPRF